MNKQREGDGFACDKDECNSEPNTCLASIAQQEYWGDGSDGSCEDSDDFPLGPACDLSGEGECESCS